MLNGVCKKSSMWVNFVRVADSLSPFARLWLVPLAFLSIGCYRRFLCLCFRLCYALYCLGSHRFLVLSCSLFLPSCPLILSAGFLRDNILSLYSALIFPELAFSFEISRSAVYTYTPPRSLLISFASEPVPVGSLYSYSYSVLFPPLSFCFRLFLASCIPARPIPFFPGLKYP